MTTLTRLPDWQERFAEVLRIAAQRRPHFGIHDCALFCGSVAEALTGFDPAKPFRGRYETQTEGYRLIKAEAGLRGLRGWADHHFDRTEPARVRPGDWAFAMIPSSAGRTRPGLTVVAGSHLIALADHLDIARRPGFGRLPIDAGRIFWSVG